MIRKTTSVLALGLIAAAMAPDVLAINPPKKLPDAGSSSLLLAFASVALIAAKSFISKKR